MLDELRADGGELSLATRESLAAEAFAYTARYDAAIARWFAERARRLPAAVRARLREGHRPLATARTRTSAPRSTRRSARRTHLLSHVPPAAGQGAVVQQPARPRRRARCWRASSSGPACVIVKHNNPCGVRDRRRRAPTPTARAFAGDPMSRVRRHHRAQPPGRRRARRGARASSSSRCVFAPGYDDDALRALCEQAEPADPRRTTSGRRCTSREPDLKQVVGGLLVQDRDLDTRGARRDEGRRPSARRPTPSGATCCSPGASASTCKSNAIVLAQRTARRSASAPAR